MRIPRASSVATRPCRGEGAESTQPWQPSPESPADRSHGTGAAIGLEDAPVGSKTLSEGEGQGERAPTRHSGRFPLRAATWRARRKNRYASPGSCWLLVAVGPGG